MRAPTLYLIDGSAQLHRAYFAIRGLQTVRGLPTNATYGFTTMLRKLLQDESPEWIAISFDLPGPTFRHAEYKEYKAHRPGMEDDLKVQLPYVRRVCDAFQIPIIDAEGFEADDVIATLAREAVGSGLKVVVVSGDKDLLQLVSDDVVVLNPGREGAGAVRYDALVVEEKLGVRPDQVVDILALMGDAVDNVPGVKGIGDKGARDLVREFGSVEAVLQNAAKVKRASYREGLQKHADDALLSKRLVTLRTDVPVSLDLKALKRREADRSKMFGLFTELEFLSLAKEYAPESTATPLAPEILLTRENLQKAVAEAEAAGGVSVALLTTSREPMRAAVLGIGLSWRPGQAAYVPVGHTRLEVPECLSGEEALSVLGPLFSSSTVRKLSSNAKHDHVVLRERGVPVNSLAFDALVVAYLVNPGRRSYSLEDLAYEYLGERRKGESSAQPWADGASLSTAAAAAGGDAELILRLEGPMVERLSGEGLRPVFESMELPLVAVLAKMEEAGVKVDVPLLASMSRSLENRLLTLTQEIYALAGGEFNVNSPVQLREILFERLGLKAGRKTAKTRADSTAEEVLEELAALHELPRKVLEYRGVQKLKSTYVDALPALVNPKTGRIHAIFHQTVAATGRLSSSDPNLQNIPIRTSEGRMIRAAFVAEPGHLLLSADYSQIELRILAHLSKDATLIETFRRGEDVHDRTSREVFGPFSPLAPEEQRRRSKMINYALLYGKTAFTLAKDIGVSKKEAEDFIDSYFARYPSVRRFIDETLDRARKTGVARTLLGRLRRLPDLHAKNFQVRMEAERQAINLPVQGSAADLIKKAMLDLDREIHGRSLSSRLVLQIHDELLLEVPEAEAEEALSLVKRVMQDALLLDVPLEVDARLGANWSLAH